MHFFVGKYLLFRKPTKVNTQNLFLHLLKVLAEQLRVNESLQQILRENEMQYWLCL